MFLSTQGFQKYNAFPQPPPIASYIGRQSSEEARFPVNFRRAFSGKPSRSGDNHHHLEVDLFVLYAMVYPFARIHHRLTRFPSHLHSPTSITMALFSVSMFLLAAAAALWPAKPALRPAASPPSRPPSPSADRAPLLLVSQPPSSLLKL